MEFKNKILTVRAKSNFGLMFEEGYDKERPVWSSISSKAKERLQPYFNEINKVTFPLTLSEFIIYL